MRPALRNRVWRFAFALHLPFKAGLWYTWRMKNFKSIAARLMCLFVLAFAGYSRVDDVVGVINDLFL